MADDTQLNQNSTPGDIIATDDIGGVKHQRVKVEYGDDGFATDVSHANPLPVTYIDGSSGNVPTQRPIVAAGEREGLSIQPFTGQDLWRANELSPQPTPTAIRDSIPSPAPTGEQMSIRSESNSDTAAGIGAQTVQIRYLDPAGVEQTEIVTLNGTAYVTTVATNIMFVNNLDVLSIGSYGSNVGHIRINQAINTNRVYNMIYAGTNGSLVSHFMVPAGKTLVLKGWHAAEYSGNRVVLRIRSTDINNVLTPGVFQIKDTVAADRTSPGYQPLNIPIPALSIVKVTAYSSQTSGKVICSWHGVLSDN